MPELRQIQETQKADGNVLYLYYSRLPVSRTKEFANGEINVDLDEQGEVVGIEVLSLEIEELAALKEIASQYQLNLDDLRHSLSANVAPAASVVKPVASGAFSVRKKTGGSFSVHHKEWFGALWRKISETFSAMNRPKGPRAKA